MTPATAPAVVDAPLAPPTIPSFADAKRRRTGEAPAAAAKATAAAASRPEEDLGRQAQTAAKTKSDVKRDGAPWRSQPSHPAGPPSDQVPSPRGHAWMTPYEPWQSFTFDVEHYVGLMEEIGADRTAQQELFLLAQNGEAGRAAANNTVAKILKKQADQEVVYSWSKFVHSCCLNARHKLTGHQGWAK